jgi:hypothetical protein
MLCFFFFQVWNNHAMFHRGLLETHYKINPRNLGKCAGGKGACERRKKNPAKAPASGVHILFS